MADRKRGFTVWDGQKPIRWYTLNISNEWWLEDEYEYRRWVGFTWAGAARRINRLADNHGYRTEIK